MKYILDSNILSYFYNSDSPYYKQVRQCFSSLPDNADIFASILVLYEQWYGYDKAPNPKKPQIRQRIESINDKFPLLPLTAQGAEIYGEVKNQLRKHWEREKPEEATQENMKQHTVDIMLASVAIAEEGILVSNDSIYQNIARVRNDFKYENWAIKDTE